MRRTDEIENLAARRTIDGIRGIERRLDDIMEKGKELHTLGIQEDIYPSLFGLHLHTRKNARQGKLLMGTHGIMISYRNEHVLPSRCLGNYIDLLWGAAPIGVRRMRMKIHSMAPVGEELFEQEKNSTVSH